MWPKKRPGLHLGYFAATVSAGVDVMGLETCTKTQHFRNVGMPGIMQNDKTIALVCHICGEIETAPDSTQVWPIKVTTFCMEVHTRHVWKYTHLLLSFTVDWSRIPPG